MHDTIMDRFPEKQEKIKQHRAEVSAHYPALWSKMISEWNRSKPDVPICELVRKDQRCIVNFSITTTLVVDMIRHIDDDDSMLAFQLTAEKFCSVGV